MIKINIEELLKNNKKSKNQLVRDTGLSMTSINNTIKGKYNKISYKTIELLCKHLNCTPNDLIIIIDDEEVIKNKKM